MNAHVREWPPLEHTVMRGRQFDSFDQEGQNANPHGGRAIVVRRQRSYLIDLIANDGNGFRFYRQMFEHQELEQFTISNRTVPCHSAMPYIFMNIETPWLTLSDIFTADTVFKPLKRYCSGIVPNHSEMRSSAACLGASVCN
jgi:hypothetical protein